ncbi:hypothetical protein [Arenimonas sp.]|uniref:hypothetical protein n=1 Tax=Arenimonas sp. TaxID=1872635 RepID=UPI0035B0C177
MVDSLARALSIAGHPAVLMPAAAVIASPGETGLAALAVSLACGAAVLGYSVYKAHRADWVHIDASVPAERAQLNTRVSVGLVLAAGALWFAGLPLGISMAAGLSGLIVAAGHVLRHVAKLSLHVAFAAFASLLVWPDLVAAFALMLVAVAVAWSRIALRRHVPADILLGALAGVAAGLAFQACMA